MVPTPPVAAGESNILFVDGLPTDCTRIEVGCFCVLMYFSTTSQVRYRQSCREKTHVSQDYAKSNCTMPDYLKCSLLSGHLSPLLNIKDLFRPFTGYKEIKVFHKEPRLSGDAAMVFCSVEFNDSKCAMTAMPALTVTDLMTRNPTLQY